MFYFAANLSSSVHRTALITLFCSFALAGFGQVGGMHTFDFLNVSTSARTSALGGLNVSLADHDVNLFAGNPALAGDTLAGVASVNYLFYMADVGQAFLSYSHDFKKTGPIVFGVQHIRYGEINGYDVNGNETGRFYAGETALLIAKQHQVKNFRLGVTLKGVFSNIAAYKASAVLMDVGGLFIHPQKPFTAALVIKNIGVVLNSYTDAKNTVPFDVQAGVTFKPEHMPLRFSLTAFNLTQKDVTYYDSDAGEEKPRTVAKVLSHLNLGTEILIHKNVSLMVGYNFLLHQALKLEGGGAGAGVSLGVAANIKSFEFVLGRNAYVAGNAGYCFTLSTNVNKILKRR
jgi:hypothetical protein